jgi:hypothetical protein
MSRDNDRLAHGTFRLAVSVAAVGAVAVGVSGCGVTRAIDPVAQAAQTSAATTGMRVRVSYSERIGLADPDLRTVSGTGTMSLNLRHHSGSALLTMRYDGNPRVTKVLGTGPVAVTEVFEGLSFYVKLPPSLMHKLVHNSKPWLKIDFAVQAAHEGISGLAALQGNSSADPSRMLNYLRATSGVVLNLGHHSINGVATTEYSGVINLDRVAGTFAPAQRAAAQQAINQLEQRASLHQLPVEVWIDGQQLVRRIKYAFTTNGASPQQVTTVQTMDILSYAPQPDPTLPDPSQTNTATP